MGRGVLLLRFSSILSCDDGWHRRYRVLVGKSLSVRVPGLSSWIYLSRVFVQAFVVAEEDEETPTTDDYRANRRMCKQLRFDIFRYPIDCVRD